MHKYKTARTIKPYHVNRYAVAGSKLGYEFTVPVGSIVSNQTACGPDDNYRFWQNWHKTAEEVTGFKNSCLAHDLTYYGLNIPAEYCEPYV